MRSLRVGVAPVVAALVVACGGGGGAGAGPAQADPCKGLTNDQIKADTGRAPSSSKRDDNPSAKVCDWALDGGGVLRLAVWAPASAQGVFEGAKLSGATEAVAGLGDEAFWKPTPKALHVIKGSFAFFVQLTDDKSPAVNKPICESLAKKVLASG